VEYKFILQVGSYADGNAVFDGAMGAVVYEECEIGLSTWIPTRNRRDYVSFSQGFIHQQVRLLNVS